MAIKCKTNVLAAKGKIKYVQITETKDGGLLLGGRSDSGVSGDRTQPSQGGTDYWLVKVAPKTTSLVVERQVTQGPELMKVAELVSITAYPNPFQEQVIIRFSLPQTQPATLKVYNNQGREIATLFQGEAKANQTYEEKRQAKDNAMGMYFLRLQTSTTRQQKKVLLIK